MKALKEQAYKLGLATILRAFCYGIAAFSTNPKYAHMPVGQGNQVHRLPRQEDSTLDIESARSWEVPHDNGGLALDRQDGSDRLHQRGAS